MKKRKFRKILAAVLAVCTVISLTPALSQPAQAASAAKIKKITRKSPAKKSVTMFAGQTKTFKVKQTPAKLKKSAAKMVWTSSKKKVAKVSAKGKVTALKAGKTTIKAKNKKTGKSVSWKVTVRKTGSNSSDIPVAETYKVDYQDGVESVVSDYTIDEEKAKLTTDSKEAANWKAGQVYSIKNDGSGAGEIFIKAESVSTENGVTTVEYSLPTFEESVKEMTVSGMAKTGSVTLADGVTATAGSSSGSNLQSSTYRASDNDALQISANGVSSNGTMQAFNNVASGRGILKASASYSDSGTISLGDLAKYELHVPGESSNFHAYVTAQIDSISYAFEDVSMNGIKSASVKLASHISLHSDGKVSFDKTIPLLELNIPLKAGLVVTGSVDLVLHADGSYELTYTMKNVSGLEYTESSGQITPVCETTSELDKAQANANANAGARFSPCLKWSPMAGLETTFLSWLADDLKNVELDLVTFNFEAGIQGAAAAEVYDDGETPITCLDLNLYDYESLSGKIGDDKIWSKEFLKKDYGKNALNDNWHFEDGEKVDACSRKITSITKQSPATATVTMKVGQTQTFLVKQTPEKLTESAKKVTWSSSAEQVAEVSSEGKVSALEAGTVVIKAENVKTGKAVSWVVTVKETSDTSSFVVKTLKDDETYQLDLDGDGEDENFKILLNPIYADPKIGYKNGYELYFIQNSKKVYVDCGGQLTVTLYNYSKGNTYFIVETLGPNGSGSAIKIYRYDRDGLKTVLSKTIETEYYFSYDYFYKANGKSVYFKACDKWAYGSLDNVKGSSFRGTVEFVSHYKLDIKDHKFNLVSKTLKPAKKYKVIYTGKKYHTSSKIKSDNKKGIWLIPGKTYMIKGYQAIRSGNNWDSRLQVTDGSGKTGWFTSSGSLSFRSK